MLPIDTTTLGDRSYLVHDGRVAFVVDPQRDIDRILALATGAGVQITHVFETHIHNDYVTGGYALAAATGAAYHVNADDPVTFDRTPVRDGDIITVGQDMHVRVLATPGHTFTHLSYALDHDGQQVAVFSGGSLLYGSVGRPDLLGPDHTHTLVRHQYASAHRLASELPDSAAVYPTHGFGSFCSATQSAADTATIGSEKLINPALTRDEEAFVDELLAGLDAWPAYYAHMAAANTAGPAAPDLSPPERADAEQLRKRIAAGEWVVDLRNRVAFTAGHLAGTLNFGLDGSFATYLGWLIPWGTPLTLLGETPDQIAEAQRELVRIGIDRPAAHATGTPQQWAGGEDLATIPRATFADLALIRHHRHVTVLDVRRDLERAGAHIDGALHIPLHDLLRRLDDVPGGEIWVHCAAGYRATVAASLLAAGGRHVVAVDDDFDQARANGLLTLAAS
ncbi:rhodanese-like domain-containing protein [Actinoplanes sp. NPDC049599]|uniref:rhodanese-like domain-containing protein n=1 Tax=Actinoplanes sp. NPDC049599 TaxID=3363903 RepID=UPI0037A1161A